CPETRLASDLTTPKLTMKETTIVVEATLNSSAPISGTTVRSSPTIPPTKALMSTRSENCCQFSRSPSRMVDEARVDDWAAIDTPATLKSAHPIMDARFCSGNACCGSKGEE